MSSPLCGPAPPLVSAPASPCYPSAQCWLGPSLLANEFAPSLALEVAGESLSLRCGHDQADPDSGPPQNAQQVHFRTHLEEKPHVCPYCSRGFREKGSLVRHVRHHTGEKPFKCYKCGRGFAEHGTLNRHLRTKGWGLVGGRRG